MGLSAYKQNVMLITLELQGKIRLRIQHYIVYVTENEKKDVLNNILKKHRQKMQKNYIRWKFEIILYYESSTI